MYTPQLAHIYEKFVFRHRGESRCEGTIMLIARITIGDTNKSVHSHTDFIYNAFPLLFPLVSFLLLIFCHNQLLVFDNLTPTLPTWEEGVSTEELPPSGRPMEHICGHCFDC